MSCTSELIYMNHDDFKYILCDATPNIHLYNLIGKRLGGSQIGVHNGRPGGVGTRNSMKITRNHQKYEFFQRKHRVGVRKVINNLCCTSELIYMNHGMVLDTFFAT